MPLLKTKYLSTSTAPNCESQVKLAVLANHLDCLDFARVPFTTDQIGQVLSEQVACACEIRIVVAISTSEC